ncbi:hypothetical protein ADL00_01000 [Streptomyces sp. AS58]|nr:hypothetical protein ADL00_01000 [Streptomyces sp. AS58]
MFLLHRPDHLYTEGWKQTVRLARRSTWPTRLAVGATASSACHPGMEGVKRGGPGGDGPA